VVAPSASFSIRCNPRRRPFRLSLVVKAEYWFAMCPCIDVAVFPVPAVGRHHLRVLREPTRILLDATRSLSVSPALDPHRWLLLLAVVERVVLTYVVGLVVVAQIS
jgi:hypothetical protein